METTILKQLNLLTDINKNKYLHISSFHIPSDARKMIAWSIPPPTVPIYCSASALKEANCVLVSSNCTTNQEG